jgi:hypothetical protein
MATSGRDHMRLQAIRFQELRKNLLWRYVVPAAVLLGVVISAEFFGVDAWLRQALGTVIVVLLLVAGFKYRCPGCGCMVTNGQGWDPNPQTCRYCGIKLRWEDDA